MSSNYNIYGEENNRFSNNYRNYQNNYNNQNQYPAGSGYNEEQEEKFGWKNFAIGGGIGLLIGGVAMAAYAKSNEGPKTETPASGVEPEDEKTADEMLDQADNEPTEESTVETTIVTETYVEKTVNVTSSSFWVDEDIDVAYGVNDAMSFSQAFATARAEVGPGGAFIWRGGIYGTYTAEEWARMTPAEKGEYGDHFHWNCINPATSDVAHYSHNAHICHKITTYHDSFYDYALSAGEDNSGDYNVDGESEDSEIEVLGVMHDEATNMNYGGLIVDGDEAIVIDVDNDLVFDYLAADVNHNNNIEDDEIVNIQNQHITVDDLGGFSDMEDYASNEYKGPEQEDDMMSDYMNNVDDNAYDI